jgi:hypothetical protein
VQNPPLSFINNHFIFNWEIEDTSSSLASSSRQVVDETTVAQQQQPLPNIRDSGLNSHTKQDQKAEDMSDFTCRLDDDPVRDAFQFLNTASDAVEDEDEEDEIVYMRYVL